MDLGTITVLIALGCLTGFASGASGGGAPFAVALLILILPVIGISGPDVGRIAGATSVALIVPTSLGALLAHLARGSVDWRMLSILGPSLFLGTVLAALAAPKIPPALIAGGFTLFAAITAGRLLSHPINATHQPRDERPKTVALSTRGFFGGAFAAVMGTGISFIAIPAMARFLPMAHAVGTNAALALPMAVAGTLTALATPNACTGCIGPVFLPAVAAMGLSAVLTVPLGARFAHDIPERVLRAGFALALIVAAGTLIYRTVDAAAFAGSTKRAAETVQTLLWNRDSLPVAGRPPVWLAVTGSITSEEKGR